MIFVDYIKCFKGTSSDPKPASSTHSLKLGDLFFETDNKIIYVWDGETWKILKNLNEQEVKTYEITVIKQSL